MQALESLLKRFAKHSNARWWVGERPHGRQVDVARIVAGWVGYPTAVEDPFATDHLVLLTWKQAAHVLALAGTTNLAYGDLSPSDGSIAATKDALKDMAGDTVFLSNALWEKSAGLSWIPLTTATFDCGVIGYDRENAFIFWVEEED